MGEAEREAARRAVLEARLEAERPWWQRRMFAWLTAAPLRFWRWLKWWGSELGEGAFELLLALAALGVVTAAYLLTVWGWHTAPVLTVVLVAGVAAFLAYGGVEFFRDRRRGRLAMIAVGAFGFVALWIVWPLLPFLPHWLLF